MCPKIVFIVPYRNRSHQKFFFCNYMKFLLEDLNPNDFEVYFSTQCDKRSFNRGAIKNIGFLAIKEKYPNDYKNISFVFNDVDTMPFNKIFNYTTTSGVVKHYYGFTFTLGGIVVINGGDFERINGFPCYWGWGMEDNMLQKRCLNAKIKIDRSVFFKLGSPEILQLFDGVERVISKDDPRQMDEPNNHNGIFTIHNLQFAISDKSSDVNDNIFIVSDFKIKYINVTYFSTYLPYNTKSFHTQDLRGYTMKKNTISFFNQTSDVVESPMKWKKIPVNKFDRKIKHSEESVLDNSTKNRIIQTNHVIQKTPNFNISTMAVPRYRNKRPAMRFL